MLFYRYTLIDFDHGIFEDRTHFEWSLSPPGKEKKRKPCAAAVVEDFLKQPEFKSLSDLNSMSKFLVETDYENGINDARKDAESKTKILMTYLNDVGAQIQGKIFLESPEQWQRWSQHDSVMWQKDDTTEVQVIVGKNEWDTDLYFHEEDGHKNKIKSLDLQPGGKYHKKFWKENHGRTILHNVVRDFFLQKDSPGLASRNEHDLKVWHEDLKLTQIEKVFEHSEVDELAKDGFGKSAFDYVLEEGALCRGKIYDSGKQPESCSSEHPYHTAIRNFFEFKIMGDEVLRNLILNELPDDYNNGEERVQKLLAVYPDKQNRFKFCANIRADLQKADTVFVNVPKFHEMYIEFLIQRFREDADHPFDFDWFRSELAKVHTQIPGCEDEMVYFHMHDIFYKILDAHGFGELYMYALEASFDGYDDDLSIGSFNEVFQVFNEDDNPFEDDEFLKQKKKTYDYPEHALGELWSPATNFKDMLSKLDKFNNEDETENKYRKCLVDDNGNIKLSAEAEALFAFLQERKDKMDDDN